MGKIIFLCLLSSLLTVASIVAFFMLIKGKQWVSDWVVNLAIYRSNKEAKIFLTDEQDPSAVTTDFLPITLQDIDSEHMQFLVGSLFKQLVPTILQSKEGQYLALYLLALIHDCAAQNPDVETGLIDDMKLVLSRSYGV